MRRHASPVSDAYRLLRFHLGELSLPQIVECATVIAEAEGHGDVEAVIRRELTIV